MNKRYFIVGLLILLLIGSQSVFASAPKLGTSAAPELLIPMGPRSVAMSGANIASVKGTDAIYWNPAGLSNVGGSGEATFSYMSYFADMKVSYLAAGAKAGRLGVLGISLQILDIGDIEVTTIESPEGTGEVLQPDFLTLGVTYSNRFTDRISFGTTAKIISEKIGTMSTSGIGFDFGLQYISPWGVAFGVTMKNIGSNMKWDGTGIEFDSEIPWSNPNGTTRKTKLDMAQHELPTSMNMGLSYLYKVSDMHQINLSGVYSNNSYEYDHIGLGGEYAFNDFLFLRGGYSMLIFPDDYTWDKEPQYGLSFGFGLKLNMGGNKISFDYANRPMDLFDSNQYFAINFAF